MSKVEENKTIQLPVTGMSCAACASSVESMLGAAEGVSSAKVNFAANMVEVAFDPYKTSLESLRGNVQSIGYDLIIEEDENKKREALDDNQAAAYKSLVRKVMISLLFTLPIVIISMGFPNMPGANIIMLVLTLPVVLWSGRSFYSRAVLQLRHKMITMDTLVSLSTSIAFLYSLVITIQPGLLGQSGFSDHVYFEASAVIISFILLGKLLEERAKSQTSTAIKKLMKLQPEIVEEVLMDGSTKSTPVKEVRPGMQLLLKPGNQVPIDGKVVSGKSYIDESMITGEAMPVHKTSEALVYAGTLNQQGKLIIEATTIGAETLLAKIIRTVQKAQGSKAEVQKLVDKIAGIFVPVVLGIALITFLTWMIFGGESRLTYALITSISVLVIACPCALGLATPTAIMVGLGRGAENNILVKDASALEELNKATTLVFDKTGTITEGKPEVTEISWHDETITEQEKINYGRLIHQLEGNSDHPLSIAIRRYFDDTGSIDQFDQFENIPGRGIKARYKSGQLILGNESFLREHNILVKDLTTNGNGSLVCFAVDNRHIATITIADKLKQGTKELIQQLHNHGYSTWLLTGDNELTAKAIARAAGINNYKASLLPDEKAKIIKEIKAEGHIVAMIGDGINDSEALVLADVGIAMGSGSDIAMDVAQVTLKSDDISQLERAIALSEQTSRTIKQNLFWAFIYNLIGIPIAAGILYGINGFLLNPMIAAAAMALSSVSVVTNSLMLKKRKLTLRKQIAFNNTETKMATYQFKTNINCGGCVASVTPKLEAVETINSWHVDTDNPEKILTVELHNSKPEVVKEAVESAGFTITEI